MDTREKLYTALLIAIALGYLAFYVKRLLVASVNVSQPKAVHSIATDREEPKNETPTLQIKNQSRAIESGDTFLIKPNKRGIGRQIYKYLESSSDTITLKLLKYETLNNELVAFEDDRKSVSVTNGTCLQAAVTMTDIRAENCFSLTTPDSGTYKLELNETKIYSTMPKPEPNR